MRRRAFTLLELIVALGVISIVATILLAALRTTWQARNTVEAALEPVRRANVALDFLRRDLESALLPTGKLASSFVGTDAQDGDVDNDDVVFCAAVDAPGQAQPATDIRQIEYLLVSENNQRRLVRRITSNLLAPSTLDPSTNTTDEVLCRGVRSFKLQYSSDGADYFDAWDSTQQASLTGPQQAKALPVVVRVCLTLEPARPGDAAPAFTRVIPLSCAVPATSSGTTGVTP